MTLPIGDERYERRIVVRCIMPHCGAELMCPRETDPWAWADTDAVKQFKAEHAAHGSERTVGIMAKYVEKE